MGTRLHDTSGPFYAGLEMDGYRRRSRLCTMSFAWWTTKGLRDNLILRPPQIHCKLSELADLWNSRSNEISGQVVLLLLLDGK